MLCKQSCVLSLAISIGLLCVGLEIRGKKRGIEERRRREQTHCIIAITSSNLRNTLIYLFPHLYQNFLLYSAHHSVKLMVASSTIAGCYIPSLYPTLGRTKHELQASLRCIDTLCLRNEKPKQKQTSKTQRFSSPLYNCSYLIII